ncbi:MAG: hypothetical protein K0U34_03580, partial [Alphaproteobacteria bacterium]|nr:hypothetical protein [Alphaproteobacteria bacterium]
ADAELKTPDQKLNSAPHPADDRASDTQPIALPYTPVDDEIVEADQTIELHDGEDVSRLASRFAARTEI